VSDPHAIPEFASWPSFPFEGDLRLRGLEEPATAEPSREGEEPAECGACNSADESYVWVSERWRVRSLDRPGGLPGVFILEPRSHLDLGDLPNLLSAELGVMTVRLERAVRSLDGVARVHVNRWGDATAHLEVWFLARPRGHRQLQGTFLPLWNDILPPISEAQWRENLALVAAWLAEFGGRPIAEPPHIQWQAPARIGTGEDVAPAAVPSSAPLDPPGGTRQPGVVEGGPGQTSGRRAAQRKRPAMPTASPRGMDGDRPARAGGDRDRMTVTEPTDVGPTPADAANDRPGPGTAQPPAKGDPPASGASGTPAGDGAREPVARG